MRLENLKTRNKPIERSIKGNERISEQGANRSKETGEFQQMEQTARQRLENFSRRCKPPERDQRISEQGANRSKETREIENKDPTARQRLENLKTRSKPLERN